MSIPSVVQPVILGIQVDYVHRLEALALIYGVPKAEMLTTSTLVLIETLKDLGKWQEPTGKE